MTIEPKAPVLERPAKEFVDATAKPPFNYQIPVSEGRAALERLHASDELKLLAHSAGSTGRYRSAHASPTRNPFGSARSSWTVGGRFRASFMRCIVLNTVDSA
jgi:hypothetical protein